MAHGYVAFVLHAHLPFVRHPEHENFLEERWLFEAISETYIPLISSFESLLNEHIDFRMTMSITPTLLTMLSDPLLQEKYITYLEKMIELTEREIVRTQNQAEFKRLAFMYNQKYREDAHLFINRFKYNIVNAFKRLQEKKVLEIIACAATHGYLPLIDVTPNAVKAQIELGISTYEKYFGCKPKGLWLPECGYMPSVEKVLKDYGIEYFISEAHGVLLANPKPVFGTYCPIVTPNGIVVFSRDTESSRQVWSAAEGYPGDYDYREFYRDIGYELDLDYLKNYICPDGQRTFTGIKYYRITGKTAEKQPYNPELAKNKANLHALDFIIKRCRQIEQVSAKIDRPPIIVCPYDAELFGHWWYEGPYWIYSLFKKINIDQTTLRLTTLSEYMNDNPIMQVASPCPSSWGYKGYNEMWLNSKNDWIYRHLHKAAEQMVELADQNQHAEGIKRDALNQAARELLLAQSSDWAFILKTNTAVQYAEKRIKDHIGRFLRLYHDIKEGSIDENWLREVQNQDNIFPELDYSIYASKKSM